MTYRLLTFILNTVSRIPFGVLYVVSDVLGFVLYHFVRYRRKIVRRNLTESFPEKDIKEIKRIEKRFYRFFCDNIIESCKMASISEAEISRRMKFTNIDQLNELLMQGHSISLFLGHYANWEWISSMPLHLYDGAVAGQIYHRLRNKNVDRLMLHLRGRMSAVNIEMRNTARYITQLVAEKKSCIIGFIADQSPRFKEVKYFLNFLNHETPFVAGPEKITKHYGFDAWFVKPTRVRRGYYEVTFVKLTDAPQSLPDFELSKIYYQHLERLIEECPELYLWTHNRFKHAKRLLQ